MKTPHLPHVVGRSRLALAVGLAFAAVQIALPAIVGLTNEPPARFGWHMFAAPDPIPAIVLDGERPLDRGDIFAQPRPELDYAGDDVVGFICDRFGPTTIEITSRGETEERRCE